MNGSANGTIGGCVGFSLNQYDPIICKYATSFLLRPCHNMIFSGIVHWTVRLESRRYLRIVTVAGSENPATAGRPGGGGVWHRGASRRSSTVVMAPIGEPT